MKTTEHILQQEWVTRGTVGGIAGTCHIRITEQERRDIVAALQQRDKLLAALGACETDEGALGYLQPAKYARKRFDAINDAVRAAIASEPVETVFTHGTDAESKIPRLTKAEPWTEKTVKEIIDKCEYDDDFLPSIHVRKAIAGAHNAAIEKATSDTNQKLIMVYEGASGNRGLCETCDSIAGMLHLAATTRAAHGTSKDGTITPTDASEHDHYSEVDDV